MRKVLAVPAIALAAAALCVGAARSASAGDYYQRGYYYGTADDGEVVVTEREVPARIIERRIERRYYYRVNPDIDRSDTGYYYVGTADGCAWLHRRAIRTGSEYWWDRYRQCAD